MKRITMILVYLEKGTILETKYDYNYLLLVKVNLVSSFIPGIQSLGVVNVGVGASGVMYDNLIN